MANLRNEIDRVLARFDRISIAQLFPQELNEPYLGEKWAHRWNCAWALARVVETMDGVNFAGGVANFVAYVTAFQNQMQDFVEKSLAFKGEQKEQIDRTLNEKFELIVLNLEALLPEKLDWDRSRKNELDSLREQKSKLDVALRSSDSGREAAIAQKQGEIDAITRQLQNQSAETERVKGELEAAKKALVTQELRSAQGRFSNNMTAATSAAKFAGCGALLLLAVLMLAAFGFYGATTEAASPMVFWARSALRVFILAVLAATSYVALQITRAYLQIREMNRHRMEIVNSFEPIVGGASPQNRDQILLLMVNAIVDFGETGLVAKGEAKGASFPLNEILHLFESVKH